MNPPASPLSPYRTTERDINVTDVQFLGQRGDSGGGEVAEAAEAAGHHVPGDDQDLPF